MQKHKHQSLIYNFGIYVFYVAREWQLEYIFF